MVVVIIVLNLFLAVILDAYQVQEGEIGAVPLEIEGADGKKEVSVVVVLFT